MEDEFRVEVELDDEQSGYSIREWLRALDLDDEARERLGRSVMVTRDGSRLFLYAANEAGAVEAERMTRLLVEENQLSAEIRVTRWHPAEEAWKDASIALPSTPEERASEEAAREAAEKAEAAREGEWDWHVVARVADRGTAGELADRLSAEGLDVARRWRFVAVGLPTEERALELADRLRSELPADSDVRVEVDLSDVTRSPLAFLPF